MMFTKPPLVELIAELRWGAPGIVIPLSGVGAQAGMFPPPTSMSTRHDEFFMRFGAKVAGEGYSRFERIVPAGFPVMFFQPVYRYRKSEPDSSTSLFQLGPGLFTANITPPYQSWDDFRPVVEKGVSLLLDCRDESERTQSFGMLSLRYIDAFGSDFTGGVSTIEFLTHKLGFDVKLPAVIEELADQSASIRPTLQFSVQLASGLVMNITAGEGAVDGREACILDTTVLSPREVMANTESVMTAFDEAHTVIRKVFIEMTKPIAEIMQPAGDAI